MGKLDSATMSHGLAGPGMDTRQWISFGIVAKEGIDFDEDEYKQPLVPVTLQPSAVEVNCRVAASIAGNGEGEWAPLIEGDEVIVAIPQGNESAGCVIIGRLNNAVDPFPATVAGTPTKENKFGFRRMRAPFVLESAGGILIRQATTTAFLSLDKTGGAQMANGDGHFVAVKSDFLGFGTKDNDFLLQLDLTNKVLKAEVGPNTLLQLSKEGQSLLTTEGELHISASGGASTNHAIGIEHLLAFLTAYWASMSVALPAIAGPIAGAHIAAANAAIAAAAATPIAPFTAALITALQAPTDPTGAMPGIAARALLIG